MANAVVNPPSAPPDERLWKRYSPHGELPWSTAISVGLHGFFFIFIFYVVPVLTLLLALLLPSCESLLPTAPTSPPNMDLLEIEGGSGLDGLGTSFANLGKGNQPNRTEGAGSGTNTGVKAAAGQLPSKAGPKLVDVKADVKLFDPSAVDDVQYDEGDLPFAKLKVVSEEAAQNLERTLNLPPVNPGSKEGKSNTTGSGGPGGKGTGIGKGTGPGTGTSKTGTVFTRKQKHEMRWLIYASPDGTVHLQKLAALNITLALPTRTPGTFAIYDLSKLPPTAKIRDLSTERDKVMWVNSDRNELEGLTRVLKLSEVPRFAAIFLPRALEDRMAELEREYNEQHNRRESQVEKTYWDVRVSNGVYDNEPTIVDQKLRR